MLLTRATAVVRDLGWLSAGNVVHVIADAILMTKRKTRQGALLHRGDRRGITPHALGGDRLTRDVTGGSYTETGAPLFMTP